MTSQDAVIRLKDGTEFEAVLNGNTYETAEPINKAKLTDANLQTVVINGVTYKNMHLICLYPWDGGSRFGIRELTEQEIENRDLRAQLEAAEQSVAELTILVSGLMV